MGKGAQVTDSRDAEKAVLGGVVRQACRKCSFEVRCSPGSDLSVSLETKIWRFAHRTPRESGKFLILQELRNRL